MGDFSRAKKKKNGTDLFYGCDVIIVNQLGAVPNLLEIQGITIYMLRLWHTREKR
jgi:hypothetical protein